MGENRIPGRRLELYPFPVAFPARMVAIASDAADQVDRAAHFIELTATTLSVLALAWYRKTATGAGVLQKWESQLNRLGITLGAWIAVVESAKKELTQAPNSPVARAIRLACDAASPSLKRFGPVRNTYAHGGKPRLPGDQNRAAMQLATAVSVILDAVEPLTHIRLGVVRECREAGATWQVTLDIMAGPAEPFRTERLRSSVAYEEHAVLAFHGKSLNSAMELTPFCVWAECSVCRHQELFYLHQRRRKTNFYFSFATGHELRTKTDAVFAARQRPTVLRMEPVRSVQRSAAYGWRASWPALASRSHRVAARMVDLVAVGVAAVITWTVARFFGGSMWVSAAIASGMAALYEPIAALTGGTLGKRLTRIEPISAWDSRPLGRPDALRRALVADVQLLFPPLAIRNLAWVLWDPARQCLHDRVAKSVVVAGRTRPVGSR